MIIFTKKLRTLLYEPIAKLHFYASARNRMEIKFSKCYAKQIAKRRKEKKKKKRKNRLAPPSR